MRVKRNFVLVLSVSVAGLLFLVLSTHNKPVTVLSIRPELVTLSEQNVKDAQDRNNKTQDQVSYSEEISVEEPARKTMAIIHTYQRCGSSFLGNMFGQNRNAFYVYEPLDALYSAMYGIPEGWSVPSDITSHADGSDRFLPPDEESAVSEFLENLLTCQLDKLPADFLAHKFFKIFRGFQKGFNTYRECLANHGLATNKCTKELQNECPSRFGEDLQKQAKCGDALWLTRNNGNVSQKFQQPQNLIRYEKCIANIDKKVKAKCLDILTDFCKGSSITATKTVRGTIGSIIPLLQKYPNLKIIHLVRDPRSVSLSRMKYFSTRGIYSEKSPVKEAKLYCSIVVRDLHKIRNLDPSLTERIYPIIYDEYIKHPANYTTAMYEFLGTDLPKETLKFMDTKTRDHREKWRRVFSQDKIRGINEACNEFFNMIPWSWNNVNQTISM